MRLEAKSNNGAYIYIYDLYSLYIFSLCSIIFLFWIMEQRHIKIELIYTAKKRKRRQREKIYIPHGCMNNE